MKKTFYQFHFLSIFLFCSCIFFIYVGLYCICVAISELSIIKGLIAIMPIAISLDAIYRFFYKRIIFLNEIIEITGDKNKDAHKIQFKDQIVYSDIKNIRLIDTPLNSKKKRIKSSNMSGLRTNTFFEFVLKNNETKWMDVTLFSKKAKKEMLEIINSKTGKNFSYDAIEREDLSIYKMLKNKKTNKINSQQSE